MKRVDSLFSLDFWTILSGGGFPQKFGTNTIAYPDRDIILKDADFLEKLERELQRIRALHEARQARREARQARHEARRKKIRQPPKQFLNEIRLRIKLHRLRKQNPKRINREATTDLDVILKQDNAWLIALHFYKTCEWAISSDDKEAAICPRHEIIQMEEMVSSMEYLTRNVLDYAVVGSSGTGRISYEEILDPKIFKTRKNIHSGSSLTADEQFSRWPKPFQDHFAWRMQFVSDKLKKIYGDFGYFVP